jgi:hypothetical protein
MVPMKEIREVKVVASASTGLKGQGARLEKLLSNEEGKKVLRLSALAEGKSLSRPLVLTEDELVDLLHKAIHAGVLSLDFVGKLHEKIKI